MFEFELIKNDPIDMFELYHINKMQKKQRRKATQRLQWNEICLREIDYDSLSESVKALNMKSYHLMTDVEIMPFFRLKGVGFIDVYGSSSFYFLFSKKRIVDHPFEA